MFILTLIWSELL